MKKLFITLLFFSNILYSQNIDLHDFFEKNAAIMLLINPQNGKIEKANNSAVNFYAYKKEKLENMFIQNINTFSKEQVKEEMKIAKLEKRNYFIFRHKLKNGSIKRVEVYSQPIIYNKKKLLFSIIHEISDQKIKKINLDYYNTNLEEQVDITSNKLIKNEKRLSELFVVAIAFQLIVILYLLFTIKKRKKLQKQLSTLNKNLEKEVKNKIADLRHKDKLLFQQSKLASMGEMLGNIAHQWKQPLNTLSAINNAIVLAYKKDKLNEEKIDKFHEKSTQTILGMDNTINDFRNFYRPDKKIEEFLICDVLKESFKFVEDAFKESNIKINDLCKQELKIKGYANEVIQVLINIFNNSKDAFLENEISNAELIISTKEKKDFVLLRIEDNAGGIDTNIIEKVFEPYFTTKFKSSGTGIGLYMSKMIIEDSMNGKIYLENHKEGIRVNIELPRLRDVIK